MIDYNMLMTGIRKLILKDIERCQDDIQLYIPMRHLTDIGQILKGLCL
jgi:hypothetical protein